MALGLGKAFMDRPSFSDADEARMARENAKKFEAEHQMWEDPLLEAYLTQITQRIVSVAKPRPFPYRIRVVNEASINAFTFGGGLIYVHAGLLARMENEAEFVTVLAHEIAHVTEQHVTKGIEAAYGIQLLGQVAATGAAASGTLPPAALEKTFEYSMNAAINGYGRSQETEADEVGLEYLVKAGYDPREAPRTFEQLMKEYGDQTSFQNFFYGSHPTNAARIERTTELVKSKYAKDLATRRLVVNTQEFMQRTRVLVVATGILDYDTKRFNTATAMFKKAARADAADPVPHYYLGKIALETGSDAGAVDRAIAHLGDATKADAKYALAYRELGLAYYRKGDKPKAISAFERYLALDPSAKDADRIRASITELKR